MPHAPPAKKPAPVDAKGRQNVNPLLQLQQLNPYQYLSPMWQPAAAAAAAAAPVPTPKLTKMKRHDRELYVSDSDLKVLGTGGGSDGTEYTDHAKLHWKILVAMEDLKMVGKMVEKMRLQSLAGNPGEWYARHNGWLELDNGYHAACDSYKDMTKLGDECLKLQGFDVDFLRRINRFRR